MSHKLVVEFSSREEMLDFVDEVRENREIDSYAIVGVQECNPTVSNSIRGNASGVIQCGHVDGGVTLR